MKDVKEEDGQKRFTLQLFYRDAPMTTHTVTARSAVEAGAARMAYVLPHLRDKLTGYNVIEDGPVKVRIQKID